MSLATRLRQILKPSITFQNIQATIKGQAVSKAFTTPETDLFFKTLRQLGIIGGGATNPYKTNPWVFASLSAISTNISAVPLQIVDKAGKPQENHSALDVLTRPNPSLLGFQLMEAIVLHLDLNGEAFLYLPERTNITKFAAPIYVLDPNKMRPILVKDPIINENVSVRAWWYDSSQGQPVFLEAINIVHFKYYNPDNPFRGMSRWEAATKGLDQDRLATEFNINYFKRGAVMSGVLSYPADAVLTDAQYNRIKNQFSDEHEGVQNAFRTYLVEGGGEFKPLDIKMKDMAFEGLKKLSRAEVFAVFNTNPVVLGLFEDVKSEEGTKTAIKMWWTQSLMPRIRLIQETWNNEVFRWIEGGKLKLRIDVSQVKALQTDMLQNLKIAKEMIGLGYPMNYVADKLELGLDKFDWLDVWWMGGNLKPIESVEDGQPLALPEPEIEDKPNAEIDPDEPDDIDEPEDGSKSYILNNKQRNQALKKLKVAQVLRIPIKKAEATAKWRKYFSVQQKQERVFESKTKKWLFKQRSKVLANLERQYRKKGITKDITDAILDPQSEIEALIGTYEILYFDAFEAGAVMVTEELGSSAFFAFEPLKEEALGDVTRRITRIPEMIVETINNKIRSEMTTGVTNGEGVNELKKRIRAVYNFEQNRILTIARTESASMINEGRFAEMAREGIEFHEWVTARNENVRDSHASQDGDIVKLGTPFANGLAFPNDPSGATEEVINCMCLTLPVESMTDKF
ncbi:MAG: phage portal protein [Candidatus Anammoxibacter sp.]